MTNPMHLLRRVASFLCLALGLSGCGSSSPTAPASTPAPIPCTQNTVFQASGQLPANTADFETFTTTTTGRVDVTVDWTFASSRMGVFVSQGPCSFDQFKAGACNLLLSLTSPPKPLKGSVPGLAPGTYGLIIVNANAVQESVSAQVVLSSSTCPAAASVTAHGNGELPSGIDREVMGTLR